MEAPNLKKAGILALILVVIVIGCWEFYLRNKGYNIAYDDGKELWSDKRAMVYEPTDKATVFVGASRNKFDLDIVTWQSLTGEHAIQLAIEGNSPLPVFDDLANDKNFKGKVVFDVTEGTFFYTPPDDEVPKERISWLKKQTPAQHFSFIIDKALESKFVFLDKDGFSLNALLDKLPLSKRKGVINGPEFPVEFNRVSFDRQDIMMNKFITETVLQDKVKAIWRFFGSIDKSKPITGASLDSMLLTIKKDCNKIKARGGNILFVHTPCSGSVLAKEKINYPREKYWDKLLSVTNCPGIHFKDYPAIDHFECPEDSHLSQPQAIVWTKNLIKILEEEKGWSFPYKQLAIK